MRTLSDFAFVRPVAGLVEGIAKFSTLLDPSASKTVGWGLRRGWTGCLERSSDQS